MYLDQNSFIPGILACFFLFVVCGLWTFFRTIAQLDEKCVPLGKAPFDKWLIAFGGPVTTLQDSQSLWEASKKPHLKGIEEVIDVIYEVTDVIYESTKRHIAELRPELTSVVVEEIAEKIVYEPLEAYAARLMAENILKKNKKPT